MGPFGTPILTNHMTLRALTRCYRVRLEMHATVVPDVASGSICEVGDAVIKLCLVRYSGNKPVNNHHQKWVSVIESNTEENSVCQNFALWLMADLIRHNNE
jgi:hypothetical protein